jgi:hypothetical protein
MEKFWHDVMAERSPRVSSKIIGMWWKGGAMRSGDARMSFV